MKSLLLLIVIPALGFCQSDAARKLQFNLDRNVALDGYDPVSYFSGRPEEGDDDLTHTHKGVIYYFANAANQSKFKEDPSKYEPAYGGWCAYAMGESGEKVKVDPETFKLIDGRLYLFYNFWGNNTLETWNKNEATLKQSADRHWKQFIP